MLGDEFRRAGHDVDVEDLRTGPDASARDLVVLGSGVQAGQWYPESTAWVTANEASLTATRVALFNVCLNAANGDKRDEALGYNRSLAARVHPVTQESFAGRYVPERVSWVKRMFLRTMQQAAQDHVDEATVRAWGRRLVEVHLR